MQSLLSLGQKIPPAEHLQVAAPDHQLCWPARQAAGAANADPHKSAALLPAAHLSELRSCRPCLQLQLIPAGHCHREHQELGSVYAQGWTFIGM